MTDVAGLTLPAPVASINALDAIEVDAIHRTQIFNQEGSLSFEGFVPGDFQISLQTEWGPMFPSMSASELAAQITGNPLGKIETIAQAFGGSTKAQALSAQAWQGPAYLQISLPIQIDAYADTRKEIIDRLIAISKFTTPRESNLGMLVAPGPVPAEAVAGNILGLFSAGSKTYLESISEESIIYCRVGKFFQMHPCVVTSVVAAFNGQPEDVTSNPMSVEFNIELTSYFAVTQNDIVAWFSGGFGNAEGT
ncbi:MAG: hypothetical protein ACRC6V_03480 [Bacteroidales bacterium]